ncbi:MAG TPA: glycosyl transferase [Desulfobulbaceae bacterium]|nr:glycosyl transferase [Desulfobulbaceae bacterium]
MKVLHVYRTYFPDPPGGIQEAVRQICLAIQPLGVENTVFTLSPHPEPSEIQRPEARVVRCRSWAAPASCDLGDAASLKRFRRLAREADVIHYLFPWPFADVLHQAACSRTPAALTYVSDIVRQRLLAALYAPLMRQTLRQMRVVVYNSPAYARTSPVLQDPAISDRLRLIPLGIDQHSYPAKGDERIFQRLGIRSQDPFFLFVGVLRYYKGLTNLLRAAGKVPAKIVIAGTGPEEGALQSGAAAIGASNVVFAGHVSDVEKVALLQRCRALVLPSHRRSEAFGMVLVEASMFGKAMICCEIGTGTSFVNVHGETGLVIAPDDLPALETAMNRLLQDASLAARMGLAARRRYERYFSAAALGRNYGALFKEMAGSKSSVMAS